MVILFVVVLVAKAFATDLPTSTPRLPFIEPSCVLSATPSTVQPGESTTLLWTTVNSPQLNIDHDVGIVGATGYRGISPARTTTYTATIPDATATCTTTVTVTDQPQPLFTNFLRPWTLTLNRGSIVHPDSTEGFPADRVGFTLQEFHPWLNEAGVIIFSGNVANHPDSSATIVYDPRASKSFDMFVYMKKLDEEIRLPIPDEYLLVLKMMLVPNNDMATGVMSGVLQRPDQRWTNGGRDIPLALYNSTATMTTLTTGVGDKRK